MDVANARHLGMIVSLCAVLSLTACKNDPPQVTETFPETKSECAPTAVENRFLVHWKDGSVSIEHAANREAFISDVLMPNEGEIDFVENDQVVRLSEPGTITVQPHTAGVDNWGQLRIGAPDVWNQGIDGSGVIVAVIDSGADPTHPQLSAQLAINEKEIPDNGIDDDGNGLIDDVTGFNFEHTSMSGKVEDVSGHGTHVSGIILADHSKGDILGMAPKAKLLPLNFMNSGAGSVSDAIQAMYYAASRGAKVINASWGGAPCSKTLQKAIMDMERSDVLFIAASGNEGTNLDRSPSYPAAFGLSGQITVGAVSPYGVQMDWSNFSTTLVHLVAPGQWIWSTYPDQSYAKLSGTSMAAPFVAGAAALIWSARPKATVMQVRSALLSSVDPGRFDVSTSGSLNVKKAIEEIKRMVAQ